MITIIDYGSGNIKAICNIYDRLNIAYKVAKDPAAAVGAEKLFLPGVGAFDETIEELDRIGFREVLDKEVLVNKVPIIGICVGMQILANSSEEGELNGLGYIKGRVKKIDKSQLQLEEKPKLPHMGWNSINVVRDSPLLREVNADFGFYFLHNYYFDCEKEEDVLAVTNYGKSFASVVHNENVYGVQFHPEKSHHNGVTLLHNFAKL